MLKELRERNKMSQAELAKLSGLSLRTLQDYEQGRRELNSAKAITVFQLSKILNCNIEELLKL